MYILSNHFQESNLLCLKSQDRVTTMSMIEEEEDFFSSKKRLKFIQVVNTTTFRSLKVSDQQNQRVVCRIPLDFSSKIPLYISNQVYLI